MWHSLSEIYRNNGSAKVVSKDGFVGKIIAIAVSKLSSDKVAVIAPICNCNFVKSKNNDYKIPKIFDCDDVYWKEIV